MSDQIYANGRIAVLSTKLLGADKFSRLAECVTMPEALKVLTECGYANGLTVQNPNDYEQILIAELDYAVATLKELCFDKNAVKYFLCKYNYHNAKVLMKCKYMRTENYSSCFGEADLSPQSMYQSFVNDDYSQLSHNMQEACDKIDTSFADGNRSPQVVDVALDKACFADMQNYAARSSISLVKKLCDWQINTTNLMLIYRLKKAGAGKDSLNNWFVAGGSIKRATVDTLWDKNDISVLSDEYRAFYALCASDKPDLAAAEAYQKAHRNKIIADAADMLTIQPVIAYFYNKTDEIDKVRMVLINVKNGTGSDKIKEMLK